MTDPKNPILKWNIENRLGSGGFAHLGQSWSAPYLAKVRVDATSALKDVAIFTGGYDINQDTEVGALRNSIDSVGNDIFIVDAKSSSAKSVSILKLNA